MLRLGTVTVASADNVQSSKSTQHILLLQRNNLLVQHKVFSKYFIQLAEHTTKA